MTGVRDGGGRTATAPIIRYQRVNKWFGKLHVLKDVDLDVARGEVLVVCGPSGSGKSTLIRCVNRLESIQGGMLTVDGRDVQGSGVDLPRLRADVGMVFQQFNLYPHMTVLQNITLAPVRVRATRPPRPSGSRWTFWPRSTSRTRRARIPPS